MGENSVGILHNALQKWGINPEYIVYTKKKGFFIQLISRITIGGPFLTVEGSALSIKAAKRDAATIFIERFLRNSYKASQDIVTVSNNIPLSDRIIVLEIICSVHLLNKPNYTVTAARDNLRSVSFVAECEISYLRTIAKDESRIKAKFKAATKMIQVLMDVDEIRRTLESQYSLPDTTDNVLGDSQTPENEASRKPPPETDNGLEDSQTPENEASNKPPPEIKKNPSSVALRFSSAREFGREKFSYAEGGENSNAGRKFKEEKEWIEKSNCESFNDVLSKMDDTVSGSRSNRICKDLTRLQLISKIDRIVDGFEKQLCNQILETLHYSANKDPKIVSILSNEYEVLVDRLTEPKIFQGEREYDDKSVRIACLVKILLELRDNNNKGERVN